MSWRARGASALVLLFVVGSLVASAGSLRLVTPAETATGFVEDPLPLGERFGFIGSTHLRDISTGLYYNYYRSAEPQPISYVRIASPRNGRANDLDSPDKVTFVADHSYWLIGNEPNADAQLVTPEAYATLTHDWYAHLKALNPTAQVFVGQTAYADTVYLDEWWDAYSRKYGTPPFEGYTVHANTMPRTDPTYGPYHAWTVPNNVNTMRAWMNGKGLANKPLWLTEYGVYEGRDSQGNIEWSKIKDYMRTANQWLIANTDKVQRWFWFADVTNSADWIGDQDACWTGNLYHLNETAECFPNGVNDGKLSALGSEYLAEIRGLNDSTPRSYLPVVMKNAYGGWTTRVHLRNNGSAAGLVTVMYYGLNGKAVSSDMQIVPPGGSWVVSQADNVFLPDGFAGSAVVYAPQPIAATVNELPVSGDGMSYDGASGGSTTVHLPVVLNNAYGGWTTGTGIANTSGNAGSFTISYRNLDGTEAASRTNTLSPHGYVGLYQGDPGQGLPDGFAGSAIISASVPVVSIVNEVNGNARGGGAMSYVGLAEGKTTVLLPAMMNNAYGGWTTGISIRNVTTATATVRVAYYDNAGQQSRTEQRSLSPGGYWGVYQGSGVLTDGFAGSAVITSSQPIVAIANEVNYSSSGAMSYGGFSQGAKVVYLPAVFKEHILPGAFATFGSWTTGVAIKNMGTSPTTVEIKYYNSSGAVVQTRYQLVGANGYWGVYQGDWTQGIPADFEGTAVIRSSQPLVAIVNQVSQSGSSLSYEGIPEP